MSFDVLPDELLLEITQYCVDLFHVADEFYGGEDPCSPPSRGLVCCKYWKIASLSAVNTRMRRLCLPILFSCIFLVYKKTSQNSPHSLPDPDAAVELLSRVIRQRATLAQHIRCIRARETTPWHTACLSDDMTEVLCSIITLLPNLTSTSGLLIRATHALVSTINNHMNLRAVDVVGCRHFQASDIPPGARHKFLARIHFRSLWVEGGHAFDSATGEKHHALQEWLDMGMRIKKLEYYFSANRPMAMPLLQFPPSSLDQLSVFAEKKTSDDFDTFERSLAKWLQRWPSSSTPAIKFSDIECAGSLPPLCPNICSGNMQIYDYVIRASSAASVPPGSSLWIGGREWVSRGAIVGWNWAKTAAIGDSTLGYHIPTVKHLTICSRNIPIAPESIKKLADVLGPLPHLRYLWIEAGKLDPTAFGKFDPVVPGERFERLDLEIRRQITDCAFQALREKAPFLQKVTFPDTKCC